MDIALVIEKILPAARYFGSTTANTEEAWNLVKWCDSRRIKPTWKELEKVFNTPFIIDDSVTMLIIEYDAKVEQRLNDWAVKHQYVSAERLLSCYENSTVPKWKFEAGNFRILWDNTWLWLQNYMNTKLAEANPSIPTWEELEALLDTNVPLVWPTYNE